MLTVTMLMLHKNTLASMNCPWIIQKSFIVPVCSVQVLAITCVYVCVRVCMCVSVCVCVFAVLVCLTICLPT